MGRERLKEIALDIIDLQDPLSISVYITMLSDSDTQLFVNYIQSAKYKDLDLYSGAIEFAYDYLSSIGYVLPEDKTRRGTRTKLTI